jgi:peptidoglycan/xylan/chitin deacetylase (PgdA/CDA1 family)
MPSLIRQTLKALMPQSLATRRLDRRAGNCVLLTFDDGPHPEVTPAVLDWLAAHHARAVFFLVGRRIARAPWLLPRILREGHLIGNHSYGHANGRQPGPRAYYRDLDHCQSLIEEHTGARPTLFRPPGGRLSPVSVLVPRLLGLRTMKWSLDTDDWCCRTPEAAQRAAQRVAANVKARDIVLCHDDNPSVLSILAALPPVIRARGLDLWRGIEFVN